MSTEMETEYKLPFTTTPTASLITTSPSKARLPAPLSESTCIATTKERKYYRAPAVFLKRSLRPDEYQTGADGVTIHVPRLARERLMNEAAALDFVRRNTDLPVPRVWAYFESDGAYCLMTEAMPGVELSCLWEDQKPTVLAELAKHVTTLKTLRSDRLGGPTGLVVPPVRLRSGGDGEELSGESETRGWGGDEEIHVEQQGGLHQPQPGSQEGQDELHLPPLPEESSQTFDSPTGSPQLPNSTSLATTPSSKPYVFCHNDLHQNNILVDPSTLKITAILDWEYAGFYPAWVECPAACYTRLGDCVGLEFQ
ncbi:phosphotransferase enzyme family-domain-containing protein [Chaetomium sp. MPI-SDFR-AT-0129]|nr:phosphotransferase enzyme family-domain-containing protein [Chaetomium sp. MPI-SDFR-AT-0129]